jgi:hypothetical protein
MNTPRPRCPVCTKKMVSAYILSQGKWIKVAWYCGRCSTTKSLDGMVIVV